MAQSVADIDKQLEKKRREIAQLEARRKTAIAREREQARKWRAEAVSTIGEALLGALGADWTAVDYDGLLIWLSENASQARSLVLTDDRIPAEAKESLNAFKRDQKHRQSGKAVPAPQMDNETDENGQDLPQTW